uniref:Uncharacterized protein n=1 Tax=Ditylenchus dipsaci TaxID=166011 RepID=A0A915D702_9BILA
MQLLIASKCYNYNFVLYQPEIAPRYVTFFVEDQTGASATWIGWIRLKEDHFVVVQFGIKEIKNNNCLADSQLRCVHLSAADLWAISFYNKHKKVNDPARQEEKYFENMASRVPLDLENLRLIWEERLAVRGNCVSKLGFIDRRKRSLEDYGLPPLDFSQPKIAYRYVEALRTAPPSVRKIFSVSCPGHSQHSSLDLSNDEIESRFPNRPKPKWLANRIAAMLVYRQAHLRWLSINDSEKFDKVVKI